MFNDYDHTGNGEDIYHVEVRGAMLTKLNRLFYFGSSKRGKKDCRIILHSHYHFLPTARDGNLEIGICDPQTHVPLKTIVHAICVLRRDRRLKDYLLAVRWCTTEEIRAAREEACAQREVVTSPKEGELCEQN